MMTPVYLNPSTSPFSHVEEAEDDQRLKLFISSPYNYNEAASSYYSLSFPAFFGSHEDQTAARSTSSATVAHDHQSQLYRDHKADIPKWHGGTSAYDQACSPSSSLVQPVVDVISNRDHNKLFICADHEREINIGREEGKGNYITSTRPRTVKWMSSKMRLMQKMTNPPDVPRGTTDHIPAELTEQNIQISQHQENSETSFSSNGNTASTVRVCSDCNTNTTPLWRSGPRGPKSLCNACGIRQRKARRAMAEAAAAAANGFVVGTTTDTTSSAKGKLPNKEKKSRGSHSNVTRCKNKSKHIITDSTSSISHNNNRRNNNHNKICFKALAFERVFPQDVAEAAMLLMELSCGLINHSS